MRSKGIYVSFDYENDKHYKFMLEAWDANSKFDFRFSDKSAHEIKSNDIGRIKAGLTRNIKDSNHLMVLIGKEANKIHPDSKLIGDINWINWEINKAKELGKHLIAVKLDSSYKSPSAILGSNASWAMSFNESSIINAISN